ncbi:MAG TPA: hypothetical protein VH915_08710 [Pedococcus sp.]
MLPSTTFRRRAVAAAAMLGLAGAAVATTASLTSAPTPTTRLVAAVPTGAATTPSSPGLLPEPEVDERDLVDPATSEGATAPRPTTSPRPTAIAPTRPPATPRAGPTRKPAATRTPAPARTATPAPRRPAAKTARPSGPTGWAALDAAIARIPGYRSSGITWTVTSRYGHWGTTDLATYDIFISPGTPVSLLDAVVRHEYAHVVTVRAYGGDWQQAKAATNAAFGGSGITGAERAADCMARLLGATWTNYTSCSSAAWRSLAAALLAGRRV